MWNKLPTMILRAIIALFAVADVLVCVFALPVFGTVIAKYRPDYAILQYPIFVGLYAAAICFFFALINFWILLNGVHRDGIPPLKNMKAIRASSIIFTILYFVSAMPVIFVAADADDAPGAILIGALLTAFPLGSAAAITVLERIVDAKGAINDKTR